MAARPDLLKKSCGAVRGAEVGKVQRQGRRATQVVCLAGQRNFPQFLIPALKTGLEFEAWLVSGAAFGWCGGLANRLKDVITLQLDRK